MEKVLLIGEDFNILASRAALLTKPGTDVVCCNVPEFYLRLENDRFDLAILCHSLSHAERRGVAAMIHKRWPQAQVVLITKETFPPSSIECDADAVIASMEPAQLVRTATALLKKPPQNERRWSYTQRAYGTGY